MNAKAFSNDKFINILINISKKINDADLPEYGEYSSLSWRRLGDWFKKFHYGLNTLIMKLGVFHVHGKRKIKTAEDDFVVLCTVRNGADYVKEFVNYYSCCGAAQIIFLDNGSQDNTIALASEYENVTVLRTALPFKFMKFFMKRYLLSTFANNCWGLVVDIDEFFDYPYSDRLPMRNFITYLNKKSYTAVVAHMLDMFPSYELTKESESSSFRKDHVYYDISNIRKAEYNFSNAISNPDIKKCYNGIRAESFDISKILLTKHPLICYRRKKKLGYVNSHIVENASLADLSCVLYHYKFVGAFLERFREAVHLGSYYKGSAEYRNYLNALSDTSEMKLCTEMSSALNSVQDLLEQEFLVVSNDFEAWLEQETEQAPSFRTYID